METLMENTRNGRRRSDVQREMLEDVIAGLPSHFVTVFGNGDCYTSHFTCADDAREFITALVESGVHLENIAFYHRGKVEDYQLSCEQARW